MAVKSEREPSSKEQIKLVHSSFNYKFKNLRLFFGSLTLGSLGVFWLVGGVEDQEWEKWAMQVQLEQQMVQAGTNWLGATIYLN